MKVSVTNICDDWIVHNIHSLFVRVKNERDRKTKGERKKEYEWAYKINTKTKNTHVNNDDFLVIINKFKMTKDIFLIFSGNKLKVV